MDGCGVTSHMNKNAEETMIKLVKEEIPTMKQWFEKIKDLHSVIEIAQQQANHQDPIGNIYNLHDPSPNNVLAFLRNDGKC